MLINFPTIENTRDEIEVVHGYAEALRETKIALKQEVDVLEGKLLNALEAWNDIEERRLKTVEKANFMIMNARNLQHQAEVEKDRA